jgi:hypothetical protein
MKTIPLTQGQFALVDDGDYEWLSQWNWYAQYDPTRYSFSAARHPGVINGKRSVIWMHRQITGIEKGIVDHRDRNTLNNQRHNLRGANDVQSGQNRGLRKDSGTGFKGVTTERRYRIKKYRAYITVNRKKISLGYFREIHDAARAYNAAAKRYFGEFAVMNIIPEETKDVNG